MTNEYTNLYEWCKSRLGQTLDNKHRKVWEQAGKLIISNNKLNIEIWECDNTLIMIHIHDSDCFELIQVALRG
jgi:hypothetical protein